MRISDWSSDVCASYLEIVRIYGFYGEPEDVHAHVRWNRVFVPADNMLGGRGDAFVVAQVRLSGGRMHHAMRTLAQATRAFEMMCERAVSRFTKGEQLARKQMVQEKIADSWIELRQFRLLILETAWLADQGHDWRAIRADVAAVKAARAEEHMSELQSLMRISYAVSCLKKKRSERTKTL